MSDTSTHHGELRSKPTALLADHHNLPPNRIIQSCFTGPLKAAAKAIPSKSVSAQKQFGSPPLNYHARAQVDSASPGLLPNLLGSPKAAAPTADCKQFTFGPGTKQSVFSSRMTGSEISRMTDQELRRELFGREDDREDPLGSQGRDDQNNHNTMNSDTTHFACDRTYLGFARRRRPRGKSYMHSIVRCNTSIGE